MGSADADVVQMPVQSEGEFAVGVDAVGAVVGAGAGGGAPHDGGAASVGAALDVIDQMELLRARPPVVSLLMNQVDLRSRTHHKVRALLADSGHTVLGQVCRPVRPMRRALAAPLIRRLCGT